MKQITIKFALAIAAISLLISGCKKDDELVSETVVVSHPTVTLKGPPVVILNVGQSYADEGATYYDSMYTDNGTLSTSTVVNTSEEGFFVVRYTATNRYGHEGSGVRLVAVTQVSDSFDVSGDYLHAQRGGTAVVSKVGRGVFVSDNVSGGAAGSDIAYFMFTSDSTMVMPSQFLPAFGVPADFEDVSYDFSATSYTYTILASGFGDAPRLFVKQ